MCSAGGSCWVRNNICVGALIYRFWGGRRLERTLMAQTLKVRSPWGATIGSWLSTNAGSLCSWRPPAARIRLADTRQYLGEGRVSTPVPPLSVRSTQMRPFFLGLRRALTNYTHWSRLLQTPPPPPLSIHAVAVLPFQTALASPFVSCQVSNIYLCAAH